MRRVLEGEAGPPAAILERRAGLSPLRSALAAALPLAVVLTLASVLLRLAAALSLAVVLTLAGVLCRR
jgi:hypothetical protein